MGVLDFAKKAVGRSVDPFNVAERLGVTMPWSDPKNPSNAPITANQKARVEGENIAKTGYGQDLAQTGEDIQRVKELQKARTEGSDPISAAIRSQKAGAVAGTQRNLASQGIKGGAAAGVVDEIARKRDSDIAASLYGQQANNISAERSLASNTLAGTTGLMFGTQAADVAGQHPKAPVANEGFLGTGASTVICTELYRQGYYSNELFMRDIAYGIWIRESKPHVYLGYRLWADSVVNLMQKSKLFTKFVALFAVPWAKNMAGKSNKLGAFISFVGEPICGILGKLFYGENLCLTQKQ